MAQRVILHVGQHKTGSTAIQDYLLDHRAFFAAQGFAICPDWTATLTGPRLARQSCNAKSVANAIIRDSLATPVRLGGSRPRLTPAQRQQGLRAVNAWLRARPEPAVIISAESFSFVREDQEMRRLERMCAGLDWRAILFLRAPQSWLASWRIQIAHAGWPRQAGAVPGHGVLDVSDTSWLVDHGAIRAFWGERAAILSYEDAMSSRGTVIPAFLNQLGLDPAICPDWAGYVANSSALKQALAGSMRDMP